MSHRNRLVRFVGASLLFWGASTTPALAQVGVLVDASKDGGVWWFPQAAPFDPNLPHQGKALADLLRSQGMIVDEVPRSSTITYDQLSRYRLVVAAGACASHSTSEVSAYSRYISNGGQLVLLGDLTCTSDTLAQSLGLDFTGSFIGPIYSFTPHPITEGVASLPFLFGSIVATPPATATILGRLAGMPVMGIMPFGSGRVFFLGDTNGIATVPQPFVNNLFGFMLAPSTLGDFDADGTTDITVFRPSNGTWRILQSSSNFTTSDILTWGQSGDVPVPGDYDGDGLTDAAVFRPSNGNWYVMKSSTNYSTWSVYQWGTSGDIPVPGDYDGDGRTDITVFRPSANRWYILKSSPNFTAWSTYAWGTTGDIPVSGDYDGDGKADVTVFRPSSGIWIVLKSSTNYTASSSYTWGASGDIPEPGDYDGDGRTDVTVFRPSNGKWYLLKSSSNFTGWSVYQWGTSGDTPASGDYDGDGKTDITVFRPSDSTWYILKSSTNYIGWNVYQWGTSGDMPAVQQ